jgi:seryl-tRNA synthetase
LGVPRTLIAVLESGQQPDGSVIVPGALRPWMGGVEILEAGS